jgi:hypothetical protein
LTLIKVRAWGANLAAGGALDEKVGRGRVLKRLDSLSYFGAGEGIRTHDDYLGKQERSRFLQ